MALIIKSANDVAVTVAENLGGSERNFARRMTETAKKLGMKKQFLKILLGCRIMHNEQQHMIWQY